MMDPFAVPPQNKQQALVQQWIPLAISLARTHFARDTRFDFEERKAVAFYALTYAATKFDPTRGFSFGTYAGRVIWDHLRKAAYKAGSLMSRPSISGKRPELSQMERVQVAMSSYCDRFHFYEESTEEQAELDDLIEWIFDQLPADECVVALGLMNGQRYPEIAEDLGVSMRRVRTLRRQLVERIEASRMADSIGLTAMDRVR